MEAESPEIREQLLEVMAAYRCDTEKGWDMQPDGSYVRPGVSGTDSQERLRRYFEGQLVEPLPQPKEEAEPLPGTESEEALSAILPEKKPGLLCRFFRWLFGKK